jgi:cytochrome d ubiquinol oxidase subunit II
MDLELIWFALLGILLAGYAMLDGFDLGVGMLHLLARDDRERRLLLNSIGPLWDGNEVWLVTFAGALFAAFPDAYSTAFSSYYLPLMALLFALILRAVSIEFRGKRESVGWRRFWDFTFFAGSASASFLFGVAVGNSMVGIPIDAEREFVGSFADLFSPYSLAVGALVVVTFVMHGSIYLYLKSEGALRQRIQRWMWHAFGMFMVTYILVTIFTLVSVEHATRNFEEHPWLWALVVAEVLLIGNIPRAIFMKRPFYAFVSSCLTIAGFVGLFGATLHPNLVTSSLDPAHSITIYEAASSQKTLTIMLIMAAIGMPFVLTYTIAVYWVFRGKTKITESSY